MGAGEKKRYSKLNDHGLENSSETALSIFRLGLYVESIISKIVLIPLYRLSMNAVQE
jgi:hypothetical protein